MLAGLLGAAGVAIAAVAVAATAPAEERVDIAADNMTLHATLYRPEGDGPFPAVVALHDCGGLDQRPAAQAQLYGEWAKFLVGKGYAVLFPNSFGSRGLGPQCREAHRKVRAWRERVADANAARRWLQAQSFIRPDRVSLIGWANGGSAALWTVRRNTVPHNDGADFRSAIALYPGCRRLHATAWSARVPTLILVGAADDWKPAGACQQMVAGARGRSARAEIVVYPGAYHGFDRANAPIRLRTGLVNTADPSGRAHGGTNTAARNDALKRVPAWLEK